MRRRRVITSYHWGSARYALVVDQALHDIVGGIWRPIQ